MLNVSSKSCLVALALAAVPLAGCGGADQSPADDAGATEPVVETPAVVAAPAAPAADAPIDLASADAVAGKASFDAKCSVCHSVVAGEGSVIGPHLDGVVDRKIASVADFSYSPALTAHGGNWDAQTLSTFLAAPQKFAPGTRMAFAGMSDASERANVIAYLVSTK